MDINSQRRYQAGRRYQVNRDAPPLGCVGAGLKLVPELIRNLVRLDEIPAQARNRHSDLLPRGSIGEVELTFRQALKQVGDGPSDRFVPGPSAARWLAA